MQFTSAKNHWILPTHSNVTSKIVVGFTLRGPPCIDIINVKDISRHNISYRSCERSRFLRKKHNVDKLSNRLVWLRYKQTWVANRQTCSATVCTRRRPTMQLHACREDIASLEDLIDGVIKGASRRANWSTRRVAHNTFLSRNSASTCSSFVTHTTR